MNPRSQLIEQAAVAAGAGQAALFQASGGILSADGATIWNSSAAAEELLRSVADAASVPSAAPLDQARQILQIFADRRRRPGSRTIARIPVGQGSAAELLLERGEAAALTVEELAERLQALAQAVVGPDGIELAPLRSFFGADRRLSLLADGKGRPIALSPLMRQELGGERGARSFVPLPRGQLLLDQIRELAVDVERTGAVARAPALGLAADGELRVQSLGPSLVVAVVEGEAAVQARLKALSDGELTPREVSCGLRLAEGKSYKEIAAELGLSPDTVKLHVRALYQKLGVEGRDGLVARLAGLAPP